MFIHMYQVNLKLHTNNCAAVEQFHARHSRSHLFPTNSRTCATPANLSECQRRGLRCESKKSSLQGKRCQRREPKKSVLRLKKSVRLALESCASFCVLTVHLTSSFKYHRDDVAQCGRDDDTLRSKQCGRWMNETTDFTFSEPIR